MKVIIIPYILKLEYPTDCDASFYLPVSDEYAHDHLKRKTCALTIIRSSIIIAENAKCNDFHSFTFIIKST
jgi:hypothetical protein